MMSGHFKLFGQDSLWEKFICGFAAAFSTTTIFLYFAAKNTSEFSLKFFGNVYNKTITSFVS